MQVPPIPMIVQTSSITEFMKIPRLSHTERKPSGRFQFKKTEQDEQRTEKKENIDRIKQNFRANLGLIIHRPVQVPVKKQKLQEQFQELCKKLDLKVSDQDSENIILSTKEFQNEYEICEKLGEGCLGLVKRVIQKETGLHYAIKIVTTQDDEIIRNMITEFTGLIKLQHENIVKVFRLYIDFDNGFQAEHKAIVLMELIEGKEMFEVLNELGHYGEDDAKELFKQLLGAIEYMHRHGICHRDLKPHNILCVKDKKQLKVTDFNVSKFSDYYKEFGDLKDFQKIEMWTYTGTVAFSAPEIFTGEGYNQMVDMWSAGCILYSMLSGQLPFAADYLQDLIEKIKEAQYDFPNDLFEGVSGEAIDLIRNLLQRDCDRRLHPDQALNHVWFSEQGEFRRSAKRKDTLKSNISHLSSKYYHQEIQRLFLLGSQSQFSNNSSGVYKNMEDSAEHIPFNSELSIKLTKDESRKKAKSIFSIKKSYDPEFTISSYAPSPDDDDTDKMKNQDFVVFGDRIITQLDQNQLNNNN